MTDIDHIVRLKRENSDLRMEILTVQRREMYFFLVLVGLTLAFGFVSIQLVRERLKPQIDGESRRYMEIQSAYNEGFGDCTEGNDKGDN